MHVGAEFVSVTRDYDLELKRIFLIYVSKSCYLRKLSLLIFLSREVAVPLEA